MTREEALAMAREIWGRWERDDVSEKDAMISDIANALMEAAPKVCEVCRGRTFDEDGVGVAVDMSTLRKRIGGEGT